MGHFAYTSKVGGIVTVETEVEVSAEEAALFKSVGLVSSTEVAAAIGEQANFNADPGKRKLVKTLESDPEAYLKEIRMRQLKQQMARLQEDMIELYGPEGASEIFAKYAFGEDDDEEADEGEETQKQGGKKK